MDEPAVIARTYKLDSIGGGKGKGKGKGTNEYNTFINKLLLRRSITATI
jgi:hypothetical protein